MKTITNLSRKPWFLGTLVLLFTSFVIWNIPIEKRKYGLSTSALTTDYTGLLPEKIERVVEVQNQYELQRIVKEANKNKQHISIAGLQHSQGGHTYYKDGIVLDMRGFNRILEVNPKEKTVHVESGATWEDVQKAINPYGLALQVTQSQSIFTIGGSLSVNAHGRDIRFGPMANTVREMTILTPTGDIKHITRNYQEEWMKYMFGGYGLFGIIIDVTLDLTDNEVYTIHTKKLRTEQYEDYFHQVLDQPDIAMHYARISVAPSSFLEEMYVIDYKKTKKASATTSLKGETGTRASKLALDIGRKGGKFEDFFWETQKVYIDSLNNHNITRNNVMRSESTFMEFTRPGRVEVLQEFFIPVHQYEEYMHDLRKILPHDDRNTDFKVHNITVRYASKDTQTSLSYAKEDMLGLVVLIQHGLQKDDIANAQSLIQKWTDLTLQHGGTYYLPYYPYQTKQQFAKAYPNWEQFRTEKQKRDPNSVFVNQFYDHYIK
ncbi:FAD-binding oxidoreductase [Bacillus massiliigorillae]|uniref:FAD-binding oxidoreductase n=1 Tax=Bacillus massiliigorillae TaxID=1243664 RepID=UPI0003A93148|nr:FAD-binding oxidoreductase [Bacillus massiliigorillae]